MPHTYKSKQEQAEKDRGELLTAAIAAVQSQELTVAQAAKRYGIPYSTVRDHVKGISKRIGAGSPTVLTPTEEQEIVVTCQVSTLFDLHDVLIEIYNNIPHIIDHESIVITIIHRSCRS